MAVQTRHDISRTVEDRGKLLLSHICYVDWHNNRWPWVTLNGRFMHRALSLQYLSFLSCRSSGQVVTHTDTDVPLSPSSMIWYWPKFSVIGKVIKALVESIGDFMVKLCPQHMGLTFLCVIYTVHCSVKRRNAVVICAKWQKCRLMLEALL